MPKRKTAPKRVATRRQLAAWQRQRRTQRITLISGIAVILSVLALVGYGYYDSQLKPRYQPVLRVNDAVRNVNYIAKMLRIEAPGNKPDELAYKLDQTVSKTENGELIAQAARRLNLKVTPSEVEQKIIETFSTGSDGKKLNDEQALENYQQTLSKYKVSDGDFRKVTEVGLLQDKLRDYLAQQVPTVALQVNAMVILAPDQDDAIKARGRLEQGEDFIKVATEVSLLPLVKQEPGDLGWLPRGVFTTKFDQIAFSLEPGSLTQPIQDDQAVKLGGYWIVQVWNKEVDSSLARGILLGSRKEAEEVRAKLQAGDDFTTLVKERSQDALSKEYDGQMGRFSKTNSNTDFEKAILSLELNTWSTPIFKDRILTKGGYWIIKVKEKAQERELEKDIRDILINKAFNEWLEKERKASTIERFLDDSKRNLIIKLASSPVETKGSR